ncbi:phosphate ABC transporter permease subunit PstC [Dissulfurirhabdus thermomarina]|uniref:Phosphate transport system permease protein n=1 Tax=Dissulfurirhabdus thermomarina TaxID=1765737 RepID=A0A6N9TMC0_DISTH|nr:phosphate ABC transporter permease subunit PstC [Dissulfurirhabdus thermomarina]NDY42385.1 phosphate ABC transporter permease subunit PstC [Dissulfurirhabdus thermomarina]NMX24313.1 phosphate ABC transporter permease subunit PstC [Dissulfurirhabdus thermomarina]
MFRERAIHLLLLAAASTSILVVALIFVFLGKEALPFLKEPGLGALLDTRWAPVSFVRERYGLAPLAAGSTLVTALATVFSVPFSVFGAVYIAEVARPAEREFLKPFIEILASIPSVVLGFFGLVVVAPLVKRAFGLYTGLNALTGALLLALMAVPTIISISEDAINSVPRSYKQASLALGASPFQTIWRVTVPAALPGIIAAVMLGMGRIVGETMAVMMVTGNSPIITFSPLDPVRTMTATIAAEMGEVPFGSDHYRALFCVGVVLLAATFAINLVAQRVLKRYGMMK